MQDGVFEFADVAGPAVERHEAQSGGGDIADFLPVFVGETAGKMPGQQRDVIRALAERRHENLDDVQTVKQILAEGAGRDALFEVAIAGGHHADIHGDGFFAADPLEGAGFEDAEELGLDGQVDIRDLVEKEGPAVGAFEAADALHGRPGKRAFFMAK